MREEEFYGSWWTESDPHNEVAGRLTMDSDGLRLTLYGEWKSDGEDESDASIRLVTEHHSRILGFRHSDRKLVTLLDVRGRVVQMPVRSYGSRSYSVDMALVGAGVLQSGSFTKVSFALDYLTAWTQPPSRVARTPDDWEMLHIQTQSTAISECVAADGYRISIRNGLSGSEGNATVSLREFCAFDIEAPVPTARSVMLDKVKMYRDLLTLALGRPIRALWIYLYSSDLDFSLHPDGESSFQVIARLDEPFESGDELPESRAANNVFDYQMPTLLTAQGMPGALPLGVPLGTLIRRWSKIYPLAADALTVLLSRYSVNAMLPHHRFSSLFSAVEETHKALRITQLAVAKEAHRARRQRVASRLADRTKRLSTEDAEWVDSLIKLSRNDRSLAQKLSDIFDEAGEVGTAAVKVAPDLFRNAARSRGQISHGNSGSEAERAARLSYELIIEWTLRVVLISRLLNLRDRSSFFRAASQRHMFILMLRRLAATEQQ